MRPRKKIVINDATSQLNRQIRALRDDYALVDGRTLPQLLAFSGDYGGLINFYNLRDQIDGDWTDFFISSPTMISASVLAANSSSLESRYQVLYEQTESTWNYEIKFRRFRNTAQYILALAAEFNQWLKGTLLMRPEQISTSFVAQLERMISEDLAPQLQKLKSYDEGAGEPRALREALDLDYSEFLPIWGLKYVRPDPSIYRGRTRLQKINHALPCFTPIFYAFDDAIDELQDSAARLFKQSLGRSDHKPNIGLYIAFAELFAYAQTSINTFSARYKRFYYQDVLKEKPAPGIPDSTYLTFVLSEDDEVLSEDIPAGTAFSAGQDEQGQDIIYDSDTEVTVTSRQISPVRTIRQVRGALTDSEDSLKALQQILISRIFPSDEVEIDDSSLITQGEQGWVTFGKDSIGTTAWEETQQATIGFAISSSYLQLGSGSRIIELTISYSEQYEETVLLPTLMALSAATGISEDQIFQDVLEQAFTLYLSAEGAWIEIDEYKVLEIISPDASDDLPSGFTIRISLPDNAEPIVAYNFTEDETDDQADDAADEEIAIDDIDPLSANPNPDAPTLKCYLNQQPFPLGPDGLLVYPLSVLRDMTLTQIELTVQVTDLGDVTLENSDGEVDTSSPFPLLGSVPVLGSYVSIGSTELFSKTPSYLSITIDWFGIPQNDLGFKGYYRDYIIGLSGQEEPNLFDNQTFQVDLKVDQPGSWYLIKQGKKCPTTPDPTQQIDGEYLFRAGDDCDQQIPPAEGKLCSYTSFSNLTVCPYDGDQSEFYQPDQSAITVTLSSPDYAFGNDIYQINVLKSVIDDLPDTETCREQCLTSCEPLKLASDITAKCVANIEACGDDSGCIYKAIRASEIELYELLTTCFKPHQGQYLRDSIARGLNQFRKDLEIAIAIPGPERVSMIRQCHEQYRALVRNIDLGSAGQKLMQCLQIIRAIFCLAKCAGGEPEEVGQCVEGCHQKLFDSYKKCLTRCMNTCMSVDKELKYPNDPYLPMAQKVTVNYHATCEVTSASSCAALYHLLPLAGYVEVDLADNEQETLLPVFSYIGNLYLGLTGQLHPLIQTMLFSLTGEAANQRDDKLPKVTWQYLDGNQWLSFKPDNLLSDDTDGISQTGISKFNMPGQTEDGTLMPASYQWLRLTVTEKPDDFPNTMDITANAVLTSWDPDSSDGQHLKQPLSAGTITSSVEDLPFVSEINQPLPSFGGRLFENQRRFEIRMGERLRHKHRGIQSWDYERLVLERFPLIWKVKALPAQTEKKSGRPGHTLVVVVPGPDSAETLDPTAPSASLDTLSAIDDYLKQLISPFVKLKVVNPFYVRIKVCTTVYFDSKNAEGSTERRLNDDLIEYLSPWFYDLRRAARGGQYVSESDIAEFIQTRPYVDTLESLSLSYDPELDDIEGNWYFLTSATEHVITVKR